MPTCLQRFSSHSSLHGKLNEIFLYYQSFDIFSQTSNEHKIDVFVRRTGEIISVQVIPSVTTYGDIIREICKKRKDLDPSHYYIAMNYSTEMADDMTFDQSFKSTQFQMFMKTKWLLEHIAEQAMHKKQLKEDVIEELEIETSQVESKSIEMIKFELV